LDGKLVVPEMPSPLIDNKRGIDALNGSFVTVNPDTNAGPSVVLDTRDGDGVGEEEEEEAEAEATSAIDVSTARELAVLRLRSVDLVFDSVGTEAPEEEDDTGEAFGAEGRV
jgi:hypothetical protein